MKTQYTVALAMLAGVGLGAVAVQGLHAQARPPSYVVIDIAKITDPEGFKAVTSSPAAGPARLKELGGSYIIRSTTLTALDGTPSDRFVVLAFDSKEKAQAWADAADIKAINGIRSKTTNSRSFIVEGFAQ